MIPAGLIVPLLIGLFFVGRIFGRHKMLTAGIGAVAAPLFGFFALGPQWFIILALIPIGFIVGLVLAAIAGATGRSRRSLDQQWWRFWWILRWF